MRASSARGSSRTRRDTTGRRAPGGSGLFRGRLLDRRQGGRRLPVLLLDRAGGGGEQRHLGFAPARAPLDEAWSLVDARSLGAEHVDRVQLARCRIVQRIVEALEDALD